jgi:hypothetical protein
MFLEKQIAFCKAVKPALVSYLKALTSSEKGQKKDDGSFGSSRLDPKLFPLDHSILNELRKVKMNLIFRAVLAIVGVWLAWSQLGQLTMMINTHSINVPGLVLLAIGILLLLFAIKPNFLRTKRWWEIWK